MNYITYIITMCTAMQDAPHARRERVRSHRGCMYSPVRCPRKFHSRCTSVPKHTPRPTRGARGECESATTPETTHVRVPAWSPLLTHDVILFSVFDEPAQYFRSAI